MLRPSQIRNPAPTTASNMVSSYNPTTFCNVNAFVSIPAINAPIAPNTKSKNITNFLVSCITNATIPPEISPKNIHTTICILI